MKEILKVWCINGHDDDGDWEVELFSTHEKAKEVFNNYVDEINFAYGEYDKPVCNVENDFATYDCGNHYGTFWIREIEVR